MARSLKELEAEILALPREERARLAQDLIESLGEDVSRLSPAEWEAAWVMEIQARERELREGKASLESAGDLMREIREEFGK
jgi:hypothetical protein